MMTAEEGGVPDGETGVEGGVEEEIGVAVE